MNSSIKQKVGKCIDCPEGSPDKPLIAKRCSFHYPKYRAWVNTQKKAGKDAAGTGEVILTDLQIKEHEFLGKRLYFDNTVEGKAAAGAGGRGGLDNGQILKFSHAGPPGGYGKAIHFKDMVGEDIVFQFPKNTYNGPKIKTTADEFATIRPTPLPIPRRKPPKKTPIKKTSGTKLWMEYHRENCDYVCTECKNDLSFFEEHSGYACQAHVLPKEHFPSVKNVIENHLLLGASCGCHGRFDLSWLSASKMKVFPLAYAIVQKLIPLLSEKEKNRLPEVFTKPLNEFL